MKTIGYTRLAIIDSNLDSQKDTLTKYGCNEIYQESSDIGSNGNKVSELDQVLASLQTNDTLVICKLNHLGRSTKQLSEITKRFKKQGIHLVSLAEGIDTRQPMGDIYFNLMEGLASMECDLIKERTIIGLNKAREKGKIGGRPKINGRIIKKIRHLYYEKKQTIQYISSKCGVSVGTCYKYINSPPKSE